MKVLEETRNITKLNRGSVVRVVPNLTVFIFGFSEIQVVGTHTLLEKR